jgi:hypothetical protein
MALSAERKGDADLDGFASRPAKEEPGLDHFEGRSWQGLHRHALMTMMAYAFSSIAGLKQQGGKKDSMGRRRDRYCPPRARPSSNSPLDHRRSDARAAKVALDLDS